MASYSNKAIYLDSQGTHSIRVIKEPYTPQGDQSLVRVQYSAINPADMRHFYMGMSEFVAGYEFAGTVTEAGPESPFKPGQEVFGFSLPGDHRPLPRGAHQDYLLAESLMTFERPAHLNPVSAVTMLAGATTAIDALFNTMGFGFSLGGLDGADPTDVPLLVWGGSSVVGQSAIKLAKAAGFSPVLTTASSHNHEALKRIGATYCFDYESATVVQDIQAIMKRLNKSLGASFDAVSTGLGLFEGLTDEQQQAVDAKYQLSSPALARSACDPSISESDLRLSASLPVKQDPRWKFCLAFRTLDTMEHAIGDAGPSADERKAEEAKVLRWGDRIEKATRWLIDNHATYWEAPRSRVVKTAEEGIQAIHDVWNGKVSMEKIVIQHPM